MLRKTGGAKFAPQSKTVSVLYTRRLIPTATRHSPKNRWKRATQRRLTGSLDQDAAEVRSLVCFTLPVKNLSLLHPLLWGLVFVEVLAILDLALLEARVHPVVATVQELQVMVEFLFRLLVVGQVEQCLLGHRALMRL